MELVSQHSKSLIRRSLTSRNIRNIRHEAHLEPPNPKSLKDLKVPKEFTKLGEEVFLKFDGWHLDERIQFPGLRREFRIAEQRVTAHWAGAREPRRGKTYVDLDARIKNTVERYNQMPRVEFLQSIAVNLGRIPVFKAPVSESTMSKCALHLLLNKFQFNQLKEQKR
uniref:Uncharacterized protein n=1 Tax=Ditylenchus dipsaci TaxID=166011 RepID=A0A915EN38_9BILA